MRIPKLTLCSAAVLLLSAGVLQGCKDNDFSFDNIDATIGLGADEIALPGGNYTKEIPLDDVVHLNNSNFVYIDDNGDYQIKVAGNSTESSSVNIAPFTIVPTTTAHTNVPVIVGSFSGSMLLLSMSATAPAEVEALNSVKCDNNLTVSFTIPSTVRRIDALSLSLPTFIQIDKAAMDGSGVTVSNSTVSLSNVAAGTHTLVLHVAGIKFGESSSLGSVTFNKSSRVVSLSANIRLQGTLSTSQVVSTGSLSSISGSISGSLAVTGATGCFHPVYTFGSFGSVKLSNIPDFLTDKSVNMNLYDPHIRLDFTSTLPIAAKVSGRMIARDAQNQAIASVAVPTFTVPVGNSVIVLHKQTEAAPEGQTYVSVPELGNLLKTIPDHIDFVDVKAEADNSQTAEVEFGHEYTMKEQYAFSTPLQLDADAAIAYTDSINDLNKTLKKLSFKEQTIGDGSSIDGHLLLEADVLNRLPVFLTLTAWATDLQGDSIPQSELSVNVDRTIWGTDNRDEGAVTHVNITITPQSNDVLHRVEGLQFRFRATADGDNGNEPIVGKTINAKTQTLMVYNIKLTKKGKLVGNFN